MPFFVGRAGGGALGRNWLEADRLAGDCRDIDPVDAEVVELAAGEPHQLVVGLPVLPPVAVSADQPVFHDDLRLSSNLISSRPAIALRLNRKIGRIALV